jgi:hypothetical protein
MYDFVLTLHSWIRWIALLAGLLATASLLGRRRGETASDRSATWGLFFMIALDVQMLLGLVLYFVLSPNTAAILRNFGAAMSDPVARFWAVEHLATMLAAVVLAHVGRVLGRKASTAQSRRTRLLVCLGLATLLMIVATPWPGTRAGRPLFRI